MSRADKVQEELRQQVSIIVQRDLKDPRVGFVTITRVEVTPDLRDARIYFTTMDVDKPFEDTVKGLDKASGFIRKLLGKRIRMKFTPQIRFIYDDSQTRRNRIDDIIDEIHKEKESGA